MVFCHPLLKKNTSTESIVQGSAHFSEKGQRGSTSDFSGRKVICVGGQQRTVLTWVNMAVSQ